MKRVADTAVNSSKSEAMQTNLGFFFEKTDDMIVKRLTTSFLSAQALRVKRRGARYAQRDLREVDELYSKEDVECGDSVFFTDHRTSSG